jgi:hypothetical protein
MHLLDLTGRQYGRWGVLQRAPNQGRHVQWLCRCICGTTQSVSSTNLIQGISTSCGCLHREVISTHHGTGSPEYNAWAAMKSRCYTTSNVGYPYYGARGVTVCQRWLHDFPAFLADMGCRPSPDHSVDRIDPFGDYSPGNCRWATHTEQDNNKRESRLVTFQGETLTVTQWARRQGLSASTLFNRIKSGWPITTAFSSPPSRIAHDRRPL